MAKFNDKRSRPAVTGPVVSSKVANTITFNSAPGFSREAKSELFLLGVSNFVGESSFYESAGNRDDRFNALVREVAVSDPTWLGNFAKWLRNTGNMRSAPITIAAQGVKARLDAGKFGKNRELVASVLNRADEPGELLAYWTANFGRRVPKPVKRGVGDAVNSLYNERSIFKYDTPSHGLRFADVLALTHPTPVDAYHADVFKFAIERRYGRGEEVPDSLSMVRARNEFMALSPDARRRVVELTPDLLKSTGITWEALSSMIPGGMDAKAWQAVIPSMGYMALLRNLRNFEQAGVDKSVLKAVYDKIADPVEVAKSKQLPMRFLSAYNATKDSLFFGAALEEGLNHSLQNIPSLPGRTLILVDRSGSMFGPISKNTQLNFADSAALFGSALAVRAENATLVQFGTSSREVKFNKSDSVLRMIDKFTNLGGTDTYGALCVNFKNHDRIIVITDEQANGYYNYSVFNAIPDKVKCYTFNLVGYAAGQSPEQKNRITIGGGLTDASFGLIPLLERGVDGPWPWEVSK